MILCLFEWGERKRERESLVFSVSGMEAQPWLEGERGLFARGTFSSPCGFHISSPLGTVTSSAGGGLGLWRSPLTTLSNADETYFFLSFSFSIPLSLSDTHRRLEMRGEHVLMLCAAVKLQV